ncbi:MAG: hypothetical protein JWN77_3114 [Frankiales bacterium]|nr:hypothetical protein [Frankiales bacterium]
MTGTSGVTLSMLNLVPGGMGGSEVYARELVRELADRPIDVSLLLPPVASGFSEGGLREVVATEYPTGSSTRDRVRGLATGLLHRRALSDHVRDSAVLHFPFTMRLPPPQERQQDVVTLLDVQHLDLPQLFSRAERLYRSWAYDGAAKRAAAVITISEFCKARIVATLGLAADTVHVAPLGVRLEEFRSSSPASRQQFLLYPARGWPHKNHDRLFRAFAAVRAGRPNLQLVLTGAIADELPEPPDGVQVRGQVTRKELVDLYGTAALMVFPSRYEGFGLPVVEAMASGCPVAAARAGSLPDVVGDAGVLFDPEDVDDIARGINEGLDRAAEIAQLGLSQVAQFSWARCADVHVDVYRALGA